MPPVMGNYKYGQGQKTNILKAVKILFDYEINKTSKQLHRFGYFDEILVHGKLAVTVQPKFTIVQLYICGYISNLRNDKLVTCAFKQNLLKEPCCNE